ncbi:phosphoribosylglycinamide formyltransferase [Candidatus Woesearchaeota archaeon]|nr:phosphoribosylglycinamide formyltransferase [Candidatus Woesearchaeota archaeon]
MIDIIKLAVLGSTSGTDLQYIIDKIEIKELDASIECVISNRQDAYILERAKKHNLEAVFIDAKGKSREEFDQEVMKLLDEKGVELVLLIGYMRFISKEFVDRWRNRVMNVHPSLLPKYAGGMDKSVHQVVLDNKEKETGMTIHFVDEGADTGPIVIQKRCEITPEETVDTLKAKVQKLEGEGFIEAINLFKDKRLKVEGNKVTIT